MYKNINIKMNNGDLFYVDTNLFIFGGIPQDPHSLVHSYMNGAQSNNLHVYTAINNGGTEAWINPKLISSYTISYS